MRIVRRYQLDKDSKLTTEAKVVLFYWTYK